MSAVRALQHTLHRPHCHASTLARGASPYQAHNTTTCISSLPCLTSVKRHIRSINSSAVASSGPTSSLDLQRLSEAPKGNEGTESKTHLRRSEHRTPYLDMVFGANHTAKAKRLALDMGKLNNELRLTYFRHRNLDRTLKGPYRVRSMVHAGEGVGRTYVRDKKVVVGSKTIPNIWLRDNCQCSECLHDATKQRLLDTFSIPKDIAIKNHSVDESVLKIEFTDGHKSEYSQMFLLRALKNDEMKSVVRQGLNSMELWDSSIASDPPNVLHDDMHGSGVSHMLKQIRKYGFCYVDSTPFDTPDATEKLLRRISFIRETHYGGFYDFTADLASKDTAYTNIALEAHTDNTYFSDPAGLQAFHLLSHTDGEGGSSLLVDGFKVADELLQTDPKAYNILSTVNVHAHASGNEGISIQPYRSFPVLEHDLATGDLLRVRWNSSDRASIELPIDQVEAWYDAARKFDALLKKKENEYWEQLTPGRVLIFDNWRILHGRSAFTGKRRICGAYINRDDWISKYKMFEFGKEKVLGCLASS